MVFFFFSCQHATIKAPARKESFPWAGGGGGGEAPGNRSI